MLLNNTDLARAVEQTPAPRVTKEAIERRIGRVDYHVLPGNDVSPGERVTICQITLDNGFDVRGESACVDPANYNKDIGETYAYQDAFRKLWPLFGFAMAETRMVKPLPQPHLADVAMRAKLRVSYVHRDGTADEHGDSRFEQLKFHAVGPSGAYPDGGLDEDNTFARYTPQAELSMTINNPALLGKFEHGQTFYVDFIEVNSEKREDNQAEAA